MTSTTTWMRLEPGVRNPDMSIGLQARIYDPLWLLARQWQFGEFQGEDNGSPAAARWRGEIAPLSRYLAGPLTTPVEGHRFNGNATPLETIVERERVRPNPTELEKLRFAAEAGHQFLRMLEQQATSKSYREAFKAKYPFAPLTDEQRGGMDPDTLSFLEVVMPRVPDGRAVYAALCAALRPGNGLRGNLPADPPIATADIAEVTLASTWWLQWYESLISEPTEPVNPAWLPERMEYSFAVGTRMANGEKVLTASEYYCGRVDWYDFNLSPGTSLRGDLDPAPAGLTTQTVIPSQVTYRGMPATRFWEFEDARVDFGAINAGPEDLARMLLVEFALTYGNDWFVMPVDLPVGSLVRTSSLVITNTFGEKFLVKSAADNQPVFANWRMFQLTSTTGIAGTMPGDLGLFFLPPALVRTIESRPIEEVLFLRDEMANLAWGVERVVESKTERPIDRFEQQQYVVSPPNEQTSEILTYRLATSVPDYWVPLVPVQSAQGLRLRRGRVLKADGSQQLVGARGKILVPDPVSGDGLSIFEEEIPREGIRVTRTYQLTRWQDGSTHLWIGRRKSVGSGEGSSGLQFDTAIRGDASAPAPGTA